jgi:hypothetical protein
MVQKKSDRFALLFFLSHACLSADLNVSISKNLNCKSGRRFAAFELLTQFKGICYLIGLATDKE